MQPVEDIWTCNRCGWTYPNHHPSAKHRRNHKKVCGKVPGHIIDDHHGHANGGSSDEASSGDEASHHHGKVSSSAPSVTPVPAVESQARSFDLSAALQKPETANPAATKDSASLVDVSKANGLEASKTEHVTEPSKPEVTQKPVLGSAVPHPEEDLWLCRACGWSYPNAHPSAKHRRNHKKHCPGKVGPVEHAPVGSSDDDSDGEHHAGKDAETAVKADVAAPAPDPEAQKIEPASTPLLSTTREFSLESVVPKETVPEAAADASKKVEAAPAVPPTEPATATAVGPVEATTTPSLPAAPVVAPKAGSAVPHPDDDLWICKECRWTYPNHHPSAKHRRNHKKHCPGKVAAAAPAPGGSSDDESDDEHHHPSKVHTKLEAADPNTEVPHTNSVPREFDLESLTNKEAAAAEVQVEKKPESAVTLFQVVQSPEVQAPAEVESEKTAVLDKTEKEISPESTPLGVQEETPAASPPNVESKVAKQVEVADGKTSAAPKVGSAVPHPDDDIWICRLCGWTYPNHHPSAKHRRNHKKQCGKVAVAAPAHGGSSDEDSGDEHHQHTDAPAAKPEGENPTGEEPPSVTVSRDFSSDLLSKSPSNPEVKQPENGEPQVVEVVEVQGQEEIPAAPAVVSIGVAKEEVFVDPLPAVESKGTSESTLSPTPSVVAPKENVKEGLLHASRPVVPSGNTGEKQPVGTSSAAPKAGSAVPHPDDDIWNCKECGWTYPNHHPSAKHRRNHKKHCPGKVAAAAPAPGGSSDEDSDDEHHQTPVSTPKPEVLNVTNDGPPRVLVSREFNVELLAKEAQAAEVKVDTPESSSVLPPGVKAPEAEAPADAATPAIVSDETTVEEKPVETTATFAPKVDNVAVAQEILKEETPVATTPAVVPKEVSKKDLKVTKPSAAAASLSSAVPHAEGDVWKCGRCDWTYPNAHPSAKHRRNHKKHCPGEAAAAVKGGSSDDDSDNESHSSAPALLGSVPTEVAASVPREFTLPAPEVKEEATSAAPPAPKLEEAKAALPPAPAGIPQEKEVAAVEKSSPADSTAAPKAAGSAVPHLEDADDIWVCKACGWTYPNAHPSAKHRRNHKKHCQGKSAAIGHAPGGSSEDDSDDGSSHRGRTSAAASEVAPAAEPAVKERGLLDLGVQPTIINTAAAEVAAPPKVGTAERAHNSLAQLVSEEQIREQEGKSKEEAAKSSAVKSKSHDGWVCKECGWTYPNPHPSAKHRRNHKKVCKKTNAGGSSSDTSSDDDHIGHFGKKKCFPCL